MSGGIKAISSIFGGGDLPAPAASPTPPAAPDNSAAQAERDRVAEEDRQKRAAVSRAGANPTGGLGDTSTPNLAARSLLG